MRAAVFRGIENIQVEDVPDPGARPADIVVRVRACGICGSDLHTYSHGSFVKPGQVMGHEFAGEVVAVGSAVRGLAVGDRVTASPIAPCGGCARCREGLGNLCGRAWAGALAYGRPGAFAELVAVPDAVVGRNVFLLGDTVGDDAGALVEPLAVALHAVKLAGSVEGATALVTGLGTIGLQAVQALQARGAGRVIGVDVSPMRIAAARTLGAEAIDSSSGLKAALEPVLGGAEIDVVVECSGVPAVAEAALKAVRPGGAYIVAALYGAPVGFDPGLLVQREVRLQGSFAYTSEDWLDAVDLLARGVARADVLVTHREPLERIGEAFALQLRKAESIKVLVKP